MTQMLALIGALLLVLLLNAAMVMYFARSERAVDPGDLNDRFTGLSPADDAASSPRSDTQDGTSEPPLEPPTQSPQPADSPAPPLETDGPTVTCRSCGTANVEGYQFCRWCIAPLGGGAHDSPPGASASGRTF